MRIRMAGPLFALALAILASAATLEGQTAEAREGADFLGTWAMTLETPEGVFPLTLDLTEADGQVVGRVGTGDEGQPLESISRSGDRLVGRFDLDYQGMQLPVVITMARSGDALEAEWSFADGMFVTTVQATRR
jgi:hypothetical protein